MKTNKRILAMILSLVCVFAMFSSLSVSAFANYEAPWGGVREFYDAPCSSAARAAVNYKHVELPVDYLSSFQVRYVEAPKGHSIYVFNVPNGPSPKHVVYHGERVLRLAKANGFSCILYYNELNELRIGWVNSAHLTKEFPGRNAYVGTGSYSGYSHKTGDVTISWSSKYFPGTKQHYAVIEGRIDDCVGFTLDYQVIARNGATTKQCLGSRSIYVSDGTSWYEVGSFSYSKLGTVHVQVDLDEPMDIKAVAVSADCARPNTLSFRMAILDVYCCA